MTSAGTADQAAAESPAATEHATGATARPPALRAAVIGTGFIGEVHARSVRLAGGSLQAVAASTAERSSAAADRLAAHRTIAGSEDLAEADDIDVVHICTPNRHHAEYAFAALRSGKHVVCEKPLATDAALAAELADTARERGLVAAVPFVYRFYPTVRLARQKVSGGELGAVRLLHGSYLQDWLSTAHDWSWRVDESLNGASRTFADIGSHWCDLLEFTSGHRITALSARFQTALHERIASDHATAFEASRPEGERRQVTTEDLAVVVFETDRGATGTALFSQISPGRKNRLWFEIDGENEALAFDQEHPDELWVGRRDGALTIPRGSALMDGDAARLSRVPAGHPQGYLDCFDAFVADTYAAIGGESPDGLPTFDDGARSARIVEAALESSRTNSWVEVPR